MKPPCRGRSFGPPSTHSCHPHRGARGRWRATSLPIRLAGVQGVQSRLGPKDHVGQRTSVQETILQTHEGRRQGVVGSDSYGPQTRAALLGTACRLCLPFLGSRCNRVHCSQRGLSPPYTSFCGHSSVHSTQPGLPSGYWAPPKPPDGK